MQRLFLFGEFQIELPELQQPQLLDVGSAQLQALFAYLVLHANRPVNRNQIAFLLWPDSREEEAINALRQHLQRLRHLFTTAQFPESTLLSQAQQLQFTPPASLWIDIHQFDAWRQQPNYAVDAIKLYRGDLLAALDASWLDAWRTRYRHAVLYLLDQQIEASIQLKQPAKALKLVDQLLRISPLRERSHRIYMQLLYKTGQRVAALQHYAQLRLQLEESLAIEPMAETVALVEQIRSGRALDLPLPPSPLDPLKAADWSYFTGRQAPFNQLDNALAAAEKGTGRFLLITGTKGMGKSFLLSQWVKVRSDRFLHFAAVGDEPTPLLGALRRVEELLPWQQLPMQAASLAAVADWIGGKVEAVEPAMFGQFIQLVAERGDRPMVLIVDNLQRAPKSVWEFILYLAHRCQTRPLLLIGLLDQLTNRRLPRQALNALKRRNLISEIKLPPLSQEESVRFLQQVTSQPLPADTITHLIEISDGNPWFMYHLLNQDADRGLNSRTPIPIPPPITAWFDLQLGGVADDIAHMLRHGARVGKRFNTVQVGAWLPAGSPLSDIEAIEQAVEAGLLIETEDGVAFASTLLQHYLKEQS